MYYSYYEYDIDDRNPGTSWPLPLIRVSLDTTA